MSIRNISSATNMPIDLAKKLKPKGVAAILMIFWKGYGDLIADATVIINCSTKEDDITQEWYGKISTRWYRKNRALSLRIKRINIGPVNQYYDSTLSKKCGYDPQIDFCFRDWDTSNSYFGAECKNLYKDDKSKIKRYVDTGVKNYTSGRYGSGSSENSIIGYVLSGDIPTIVRDLITEISTTAPISNLSREMKFKEPQYISNHLRILDNKNIALHHLFFDFVN